MLMRCDKCNMIVEKKDLTKMSVKIHTHISLGYGDWGSKPKMSFLYCWDCLHKVWAYMKSADDNQDKPTLQ